MRDGQPWAIEVGARLGGGKDAELAKLVTGFDAVRANVLWVLGELTRDDLQPGEPAAPVGQVRFVVAEPGRIVRLDTAPGARARRRARGRLVLARGDDAAADDLRRRAARLPAAERGRRGRARRAHRARAGRARDRDRRRGARVASEEFLHSPINVAGGPGAISAGLRDRRREHAARLQRAAVRARLRRQPRAARHEQAQLDPVQPAQAAARAQLGGAELRRLPLPRRPDARAAAPDAAAPQGTPEGDRLPVLGLRPARPQRRRGLVPAQTRAP